MCSLCGRAAVFSDLPEIRELSIRDLRSYRPESPWRICRSDSLRWRLLFWPIPFAVLYPGLALSDQPRFLCWPGADRMRFPQGGHLFWPILLDARMQTIRGFLRFHSMMLWRERSVLDLPGSCRSAPSFGRNWRIHGCQDLKLPILMKTQRGSLSTHCWPGAFQPVRLSSGCCPAAHRTGWRLGQFYLSLQPDWRTMCWIGRSPSDCCWAGLNGR